MTAVGDTGEGAPITGLSHVQLLVSDVRASAKWYSAALGLDPYADDADFGYVAVRHKAGRFVVVLTKAPPGDGPAERRMAAWTIWRWPCSTAPNWRSGPTPDRHRHPPRRRGARGWLPVAATASPRWHRHRVGGARKLSSSP